MAVLGEIQDYQIAASAVFVISTLGLVVNCLVFLFVLRIPSMANPFGHLVTNQSIGNVIHLCLFSFYFSPMVFFDIDAMKKYSHYCGVFLIMSFEVSLYTHTVISLNRFCAICLPFRYRRIFT
uniref:G_PROTEIN_RECEP_F1_2 domain-containing protein n=1 Tax=Angiostrongylus cantonensis TaxID=6313 RepID=A0A0K0D6K7_ANGCA